MLTSGSVLGGRYRLGDRIATGGMGEVWHATDTTLNRPVAVKAMRADLHHDATFGARFRAEARTMATLHHPGVVDVYDYGEIDGTGAGELAYLVMAYIHGEPLSHRIADAGHLSVADTMGIVTQAANALAAAHAAGVIHRDVKPDNLLVQADGRVVLVDFGVAVTNDSAGLTGVGQVIGTALYMAPEQISRQPISPAIDIYALGAVAYHCLAGRPPFDGDNALTVALSHLSDEPPPLPRSIPARVREVVATAMAKDPANRYPSAAAMAVAAAEAHTLASTRTMPAVPTGELSPAAFAVGVAGAETVRPASGSTGTMPGAEVPWSTRPAQRPRPTQRPRPPRRSRRGPAAALAAGLIGLGAVAVVLALALSNPGTIANSPGTGTVPGTPKPSHSARHTTPAGGRTPGSPGKTAAPGGSATPTTTTATPTGKPRPTPVNPPPSTPSGGSGSAPPSAPAGGDGSPGGITIVLPGATTSR